MENMTMIDTSLLTLVTRRNKILELALKSGTKVKIESDGNGRITAVHYDTVTTVLDDKTLFVDCKAKEDVCKLVEDKNSKSQVLKIIQEKYNTISMQKLKKLNKCVILSQ